LRHDQIASNWYYCSGRYIVALDLVVTPQLQKFCRSIAAARLISPADLEKDYRSWRTSEPDQRDNVTAFVRYLVRSGRLSEQQLAQFAKAAAVESALPQSERFDVELVPIRDPGRGFDRRDLFMILGGAVVAAAITTPTILFLRKPVDKK